MPRLSARVASAGFVMLCVAGTGAQASSGQCAFIQGGIVSVGNEQRMTVRNDCDRTIRVTATTDLGKTSTLSIGPRDTATFKCSPDGPVECINWSPELGEK